jgi:hypothetical protein
MIAGCDADDNSKAFYHLSCLYLDHSRYRQEQQQQDHWVLLVVIGNNPGIDSSGDPEGGVIDPGDVGDMELGDSVVVGSAAPVAEGVFGMPHTCDSVVLTFLSVGSHIGFCPGVVTSDPVDGERWRTWAWLTLIIPLSNTILTAAVPVIIVANNTIPAELSILFIFLCLCMLCENLTS